jgi:hypothetical protein
MSLQREQLQQMSLMAMQTVNGRLLASAAVVAEWSRKSSAAAGDKTAMSKHLVTLLVDGLRQHTSRPHLLWLIGDFGSPAGITPPFSNFSPLHLQSTFQGARGACSFSPFWFLAVDFAPDSVHDLTQLSHASLSPSAPALHLEDLLAMSFKKNAVDTGDVSVSHVLQQLPKVSDVTLNAHFAACHVYYVQVLLLHVKRFALRDEKIVKISQPLQVPSLLQVHAHFFVF